MTPTDHPAPAPAPEGEEVSVEDAITEARKNVAAIVNPKPHESMTTIMQKVLR